MVSFPRRTNRRIREFEPRLRLDEFANPRVTWLLKEVHQLSIVHADIAIVIDKDCFQMTAYYGMTVECAAQSRRRASNAQHIELR